MAYCISSTMEETQSQFRQSLQTYIKKMEMCENSTFQKQWLAKVPMDQLNLIVREKKKNNVQGDISDRDYFVVGLLEWFKNDFFKWMDSPICTTCQKPTILTNKDSPNFEEQQWLAQIVEVYTCQTCNIIYRLPRYNHPIKLLETKKGRCGEWAFCFAMLLRCFRYDTRLVLDTTDHLWNEIYSIDQNRWIHCDPCENIFDSPLVYEKGWKKKLEYIIAFSCEEVQDITWRYTTDQKAVLQRRKKCKEDWFVNFLLNATNNIQRSVPTIRRQLLLDRRVAELIELLSIVKKESKSDELQGRNSGSLSWRQSRKEAGDIVPFVFTLSQREIENKNFKLLYSTKENKYMRPLGKDKYKEGWDACVHSSQNIFLKVEYDWKQTYLARTEDSSSGSITWKFDFTNSDLKIKCISLLANSDIFDEGCVTWIATLGSEEESFDKLEPEVLITNCHNSKTFSLTAILFGGDWQSAQLFRQPLTSNNFPFKLDIRLE